MDAVNIYRLSVLSCLAMVTPPALAAEFNLNVLDKSIRDSVDISLLNQKGVVAPGDYFVSVTVNNNKISKSGMNHRFRKLEEIALSLTEGENNEIKNKA